MMTLGQILQLPDGNTIKISVEQAISQTYDNFCDLVESTLLSVALEIERNKALYCKLGEDQLTGIMSIGMKMAGFDSEHDTYRNGHADILIRDDSKRFEWIGEAKLDNGPAYLMEGFRQLCDRYSDGNPNSSRGGLIIYTEKQNKKTLILNWIDHVSSNYETNIDCTENCPLTLTARTQHEHTATGVLYRIRHIPVSLYYKPTDKGARGQKARK